MDPLEIAERTATPAPWDGLSIVIPDEGDPEIEDASPQLYLELPDEGDTPLTLEDEMLAINARNALPHLLELYHAVKDMFERDYDEPGDEMRHHASVRDALDAYEAHIGEAFPSAEAK